MSSRAFAAAAVLVFCAASGAVAKPPSCPGPVADTVAKAHPGARVLSCKKEMEKGKPQYEVKLNSKGTRLELDVSPAGEILQTEEKVPLSSVPVPVLSAFAARYPKAKPSRAEKQTKADGQVTYELAFRRGRKIEATFDEAGKFVEQE